MFVPAALAEGWGNAHYHRDVAYWCCWPEWSSSVFVSWGVILILLSFWLQLLHSRMGRRMTRRSQATWSRQICWNKPDHILDQLYILLTDNFQITVFCPSLWPSGIGSRLGWTGCEFNSWQCRIYIPCSLSLRLLGSLWGSLGWYMAWHTNCVKKKSLSNITLLSDSLDGWKPHLPLHATLLMQIWVRLILVNNILLRYEKVWPFVTTGMMLQLIVILEITESTIEMVLDLLILF